VTVVRMTFTVQTAVGFVPMTRPIAAAIMY
jgi:hypothetical protein